MQLQVFNTHDSARRKCNCNCRQRHFWTPTALARSNANPAIQESGITERYLASNCYFHVISIFKTIFKVSPNNFTLLKIIIKWKKITTIKDESKGWLASRYRHLKRTRINEEREMFRQA